MQVRLPRARIGIAQAAEKLVDLIDGEVVGLEHLDGVLMHEIEGAVEARACVGEGAAPGDPGGGGEDQHRQEHGRDGEQPKLPLGRAVGRPCDCDSAH